MLRYLKILAIAGSLALGGCSLFLPYSGPTARDVKEVPGNETETGIRVVDLSQPVVQRLVAADQQRSLVKIFGATETPKFVIGPGDALEISVWEAPPAALFSAGTLDPRGLYSLSSRVQVVPEQMVNSNGEINIPFAGTLRVTGMTAEQVEKEIAERLKKKANDPQVHVRLLRNSSSMVTVVGEVNNNARLPLTPYGERVLDALAAAGGFKQPVGKITIRVTREVKENGARATRIGSVPLETLITDPSQNIMLQGGDVITALFQSNSFTVLGATTKNDEITFEAQGISLIQALARAGGLQDARANPAGLFLFRFEDPAALGDSAPARTVADGKVPVIYRVDLKDPASFFLAQNFPVHNKDVMYVANAEGAELQKFANLLSGLIVPFLYLHSVSNF